MMEYIIEAKNLTFDYHDFRAIDDVCLKIESNTITALVGPNGAGKTTLIRCLIAIQKPLFGDIIIDGESSHGNERSLFKKIGYLSDFFGLYDALTTMQCLQYTGWSRGVYHNLNSRIDYVTEKLNLKNFLNKTTNSLSRGQRQRVAIAQAIIHDPKILFLDEPASGLDPEARYALSRLMLDLKKQGMTIVVSSHILAELEDYCDNMIIIKNGKVSKEIEGKSKKNKIKSIIIHLLKVTKSHLKKIKECELITDLNYTEESNQIEVCFKGNEKRQAEILQYLIEKKIPVLSFAATQQSFESIYMNNAK